MKKIIIFLNILVIILSCSNNAKKDGYFKTDNKNLFKIDYSYYNKYVPTSEINISFNSFFSTLYPYHANNEVELFLKTSTYSSLFYIDSKNGMPVKNLVKDYSITDFNKKYDIILLDNIRFSDGRFLNIDDVISSLSLIKTFLKDTHFAKGFYLENSDINFEKISNNEFTITLDKPNGNILYALSYLPIIKKEIIDMTSDGSEKIISKWQDAANLPKGTGPYFINKLYENKILLTKNQYYFKKDHSGNNLPYADNIIINLYNEKKIMIQDFLNKQNDIMQIDENDFKILNDFYNDTENIKIIDTGFSTNKTFFLFNCFSSKNKIFENINIRSFFYFILSSGIGEEQSSSLIKKSDKTTKNNFETLKNFFKDTTIDLIVPDEDKALVSLGNKTVSLLKNEKIKIEFEILPYHKYLEKLFYSRDFDVALINYKFDSGLLQYYLFIKNDKFSFMPFINDNNDTLNKINSLLTEAINTSDFSKQNQLMNNIFDNFERKFQFSPVILKKKYFIIQDGINNFKLNSSFQNDINLQTIEYLEKRILSK